MFHPFRRPEFVGFALSGGGTRGAVQVGALQALHEAGVVPGIVAGTSAGAVNAAWYALYPDRLDGLRDIWLSLTQRDVFPGGPVRVALNFLRYRYLHRGTEWERFLRRKVGTARFEDCVIPCAVVATRLSDGARVVFDSGELVPAVAASSAIPGVFPPYEIDGELYVDGGVVEYLPLRTVWERGATTAWALDCSYLAPGQSARYSVAERSAVIGSAEYVRQATSAEATGGKTVHLLQPPVSEVRDPRDFSATADGIASGYRHTRDYLDSRRQHRGTAV